MYDSVTEGRIMVGWFEWCSDDIQIMTKQPYWWINKIIDNILKLIQMFGFTNLNIETFFSLSSLKIISTPPPRHSNYVLECQWKFIEAWEKQTKFSTLFGHDGLKGQARKILGWEPQ